MQDHLIELLFGWTPCDQLYKHNGEEMNDTGVSFAFREKCGPALWRNSLYLPVQAKSTQISDKPKIKAYASSRDELLKLSQGICIGATQGK